MASARAISQRRRSPPDSAIDGVFRRRRDVEFVEQGFQLGLAPTAAGLHHLQHRADIVLHIQPAKNRGLLRQIADAEPRALIHGKAGDVVAVEFDAAAVRLDQTGDHVKNRGLARPVRTQQADRLPAPHIEAHAIDDLASDETFLHPMRGKIALVLGHDGRGVVLCSGSRSWPPAHSGDGRGFARQGHRLRRKGAVHRPAAAGRLMRPRVAGLASEEGDDRAHRASGLCCAAKTSRAVIDTPPRAINQQKSRQFVPGSFIAGEPSSLLRWKMPCTRPPSMRDTPVARSTISRSPRKTFCP